MARRRRSRRRRSSGLGSVIAVRRTRGLYGRRRRRRRGLGQTRAGFSFARDVMPMAIGAGTAAATVGGIRHFVDPAKPDATETEKQIFKYAPFLGILGGALGSGLAWYATKKKGGKRTLYAGIAGAAVVGLTGFMMDQLLKAKTATTVAAIQGLGAIVPEYAGMAGVGHGGLGAIVMEPQASRGYGAGALGSYGEEVNLGSINQGAFGTAGFTV